VEGVSVRSEEDWSEGSIKDWIVGVGFVGVGEENRRDSLDFPGIIR